LVFREAPGPLLRVHESALYRDLEHSSRSFDELDLDSVESLLKLGDQTGRLRVIVSLHTEFDLDVHGWLFF